MNAGRIVYDGPPSQLCQATVDAIYCCPPKQAKQEKKLHYFPCSPAAASAV